MHAVHGTTTTGGHRRGRRYLAAGVAAAALALGAAVPAAGAGTTPCPTGAFAFTSTLTNGALKIGSAASSSGNTATACGAIKNVNGQLTAVVAPGNLQFTASKTKVLFLSLPTTVTQLGEISGPVVLGAGGTSVTLGGPLKAETNILGMKCTIGPLTPKLTTGTSGALTGSKFVKDATTGLMNGKLVANDFVVPKVQASSTCPQATADLTNKLLGLPLAAGKSSITFDGSIKLGV